MVVFSSHLALPLQIIGQKYAIFHYVDLTSTAENTRKLLELQDGSVQSNNASKVQVDHVRVQCIGPSNTFPTLSEGKYYIILNLTGLSSAHLMFPPHNVVDSNLVRSPSGEVVGDYVLHTLRSPPRNVANNELLPIRSPGNLVYDYALPEVDDYALPEVDDYVLPALRSPPRNVADNVSLPSTVFPALRSPPRNVADNVSLPSTVKRTSSRKSRSKSPSRSPRRSPSPNNPRRIAHPHSPRRSSSPHNPRRSPSPNNPRRSPSPNNTRRIAPPNSRRAMNSRPRRSTSPNIVSPMRLRRRAPSNNNNIFRSKDQIIHTFDGNSITFKANQKFKKGRVPNKACRYLLSHCSRRYPTSRDKEKRAVNIFLMKKNRARARNNE
ncbi:hypothetical protein TNIN_276541 [Trichonephila inaurata madagascariensis]|uniref:Uncharacterized protein n=1 Tax=Trichonephila inaurata madagascariensis TaxID=2747483 RepID=A0A8X7BPT6_9ARAC|nr:hypothetical protein TNIN_276541 [Trichonephila inaurata madagascariensis]